MATRASFPFLWDPISWRFRGLLQAILWSASWIINSLVCSVAIAASNSLLDEVIAGSDENLAKIQFGKAVYQWHRKPLNPVQREEQYRVTVYFDGKTTRSDNHRERLIVDPERYVSFWSERLGMKEYEPSDFNAIIRERSYAPSFRIHPYVQGLGRIGTVADELRATMNNPAWHVSAQREANLIHIVAESKEMNSKAEYFVDPEQGYVPIRYVLWNLTDPKEPAIQVVTDLQQTADGAFIAKRFTIVEQLRTLQKSLGTEFSEAKLTEYSPLRPDPLVFTLEGLGLPVGARVQDRIHGGEYVFGMAPIGVDMELPPLSGPAPYRLWLIGLNVALILVLIGALVVRNKRLAS